VITHTASFITCYSVLLSVLHAISYASVTRSWG